MIIIQRINIGISKIKVHTLSANETGTQSFQQQLGSIIRSLLLKS